MSTTFAASFRDFCLPQSHGHHINIFQFASKEMLYHSYNHTQVNVKIARLTYLSSHFYRVVCAVAVALRNKMLHLTNNHQRPESDIRRDQLRLHRDYHIDKQLDHIHQDNRSVDSQIVQPYRSCCSDYTLYVRIQMNFDITIHVVRVYEFWCFVCMNKLRNYCVK